MPPAVAPSARYCPQNPNQGLSANQIKSASVFVPVPGQNPGDQFELTTDCYSLQRKLVIKVVVWWCRSSRIVISYLEELSFHISLNCSLEENELGQEERRN